MSKEKKPLRFPKNLLPKFLIKSFFFYITCAEINSYYVTNHQTLNDMKKSRICLLTLLTLLLLSSSLVAQNFSEKIPTDAKVKTGKLKNGLTYFIRENKKPENRVELRLVVNAGYINEDDDQQGLAHMTEHMAFNGTKNFKKNEIISYLQDIGVGFGSDLNAYTSFDETVYMLPIPTDKPGNLEKGFRILE